MNVDPSQPSFANHHIPLTYTQAANTPTDCGSVVLNECEFSFRENTDGMKQIVCNGRTYTNLPGLTKDFPLLLQPKSLVTYAKMVNFLSKGLEYEVIENSPCFLSQQPKRSSSYEELIEAAQPYTRLCDFDCSQVSSPKISKQKLKFYVIRGDETHIPYKVTCSYPLTLRNSKISYKLLG